MSSGRPRVIPCAIYAPGRKITQLVIEGRNVPGTLAVIASRMAELGINILSGLVTAEPGKETGTITLFLDLTNTGLTPEELLKEIRSLEVVADARETVKKLGDIAINGTAHTTLFLDKRVIMLGVEDVSTMFNWLDETFRTGAHAILFNMGEQAGRAAARELNETYGLRGRELVEAFLALHAAAGWFDYEVASFDEEALNFVIRLYDNFECAPFAGRKKRPMSHLVRGGLAGLFSGIYGRDFKSTEVKCLAKGDPYCEFVLTPREQERP